MYSEIILKPKQYKNSELPSPIPSDFAYCSGYKEKSRALIHILTFQTLSLVYLRRKV
jgi:hypothetical protein